MVMQHIQNLNETKNFQSNELYKCIIQIYLMSISPKYYILNSLRKKFDHKKKKKMRKIQLIHINLLDCSNMKKF